MYHLYVDCAKTEFQQNSKKRFAVPWRIAKITVEPTPKTTGAPRISVVFLLDGTMATDISHALSEAPVAKPAAGEQPLLTAAEVAKFLSLSVRTLWRLDSGGRLPLPVLVGNSKRWRPDEMRDWVNAGCPLRHSWAWNPG